MTDNLTPFARPFAFNSLLFAEFERLRAELDKSPFTGPALKQFEENPPEVNPDLIQPLPEGLLPDWERTLLELKTIARLPYVFKIQLAVRESIGNPVCRRDGNTVIFILPYSSLETPDPQLRLIQAAFALGICSFLERFGPVKQLLVGSVPMLPEDRSVMERFVILARCCLALFPMAVTGDADAVARYVFANAEGAPPGNLDLVKLAEQVMKESTGEHRQLLTSSRSEHPYPVLLPIVLERFLQTHVYRSLRGSDDGNPWEQFEAEVLELHEQVYSKEELLTSDEEVILCSANVLLAFAVLHEFGGASRGRDAAVIELLEADEEQIAALQGSLNWKRGREGNSLEILLKLADEGPDILHEHVLGVTQVAIWIAYQESLGELPDEIMEVFQKFGEHIRLSREEVMRVIDYQWVAIKEAESECDENDN